MGTVKSARITGVIRAMDIVCDVVPSGRILTQECTEAQGACGYNHTLHARKHVACLVVVCRTDRRSVLVENQREVVPSLRPIGKPATLPIMVRA